MGYWGRPKRNCPCGKSGPYYEICDSCQGRFTIVPMGNTVGMVAHMIAGIFLGLLVGIIPMFAFPAPLSGIGFWGCIIAGAILAKKHWESGRGIH